MNIALFGATGKTGSIILQKLIEQEAGISVLVRLPSKLGDLPLNIKIIEGSILDSDKVYQTIEGCDAVICVVGHVKGTSENMQRDGIKNIIAAMDKLKAKRLVTLTGSGVFTKGDSASLFDKIMRFMVKTITPSRFNDGANMSEIIKQSNLDWVIVRAPLITNEKAKDLFQVFETLLPNKPAFRIGRDDLAEFIIGNLEMDDYIRKMPVVSY